MASILCDGLWLDRLRLLLSDLVLLIRVVGIHLVLEYHFLDRMSVGGRSLVVTEDHALGLVLSEDYFVDHLVLAIRVVVLLLESELLDAVRVDLELLVAEFVLGEILVARDQGVEVEGLLVGSVDGKLEVINHVADVDVIHTGGRLVV